MCMSEHKFVCAGPIITVRNLTFVRSTLLSVRSNCSADAFSFRIESNYTCKVVLTDIHVHIMSVQQQIVTCSVRVQLTADRACASIPAYLHYFYDTC